MKTLSFLKRSTLYMTVLALSFAACSDSNNDVESVTQEDLEAATQIVGTSLSDDESGLMSSMYDTYSDIDDSGIYYESSAQYKESGNGQEYHRYHGREFETNYVHAYDSLTGIHTITFDRNVSVNNTNNSFSKSVSIASKYIFTDPDGNFIAEPKLEKSSVNTIYFTSLKTGSLDGRTRESNFSKVDTMFVQGLHSSNPIVYMNGNHYENGDASLTLKNGSTMSRNYTSYFTLEDIAVEKDTVSAYGNLEHGVTGILTFKIEMTRTRNDNSTEKVVEGTVELVGDGTALIQFAKSSTSTYISLISGEEID